jgi:hypothetical protein
MAAKCAARSSRRYEKGAQLSLKANKNNELKRSILLP